MNRPHALQRRTFYALLVILLASGLAWETMSPGSAASLVMKIHGVAAMLVLVVLGTLLTRHVPAGWEAGKSRTSGVFMLSALLWLAGTGYALYYAGDERLRWYAAQSHLWIGLAATAIVLLHIRRSALT